MALITLTLKGGAEVKKKFQQITPAIRSELLFSLERMARRVHADATKGSPVGQTGDLRNELKFDVDAGNLSASVYSEKPYASSVHEGLKAGQVFPDWTQTGRGSLQGWVGTKLRVPQKERRSVAFLVARSIHDKGTEAQPFLADAVEKNRQFIVNEFTHVLGSRIESKLKQ